MQILRSAYEAAYATAALHAGVHPEPLSMSDVSFKQPVTVGSIVEFDAKVGPLQGVSGQTCMVAARCDGRAVFAPFVCVIATATRHATECRATPVLPVSLLAQVVLTHSDLMRVAVQAIKFEPAQGGAGTAPRSAGQQALTTTFSFLFAVPPGAQVPPVVPESLADASEWLLAARQHADDGYPPPPAAE